MRLGRAMRQRRDLGEGCGRQPRPHRAPPIREQRGDADLPGADRLVAARDAALEEPCGDVPDAARIAETPAHGAPPAGGRVLAIGARGAGPRVEPPPTGPAAEPPGAERGAPLPLRRGRGCPVGTRQPRPLTIPRMRLAEASEPCVLTEPTAIDWLNAVTDQSANFFAVELQVWRIEDSKPAPQFNLVAQSNEWAKTVRETASGPKMTPTRQLQLDYRTELRAYLEEQGSEVRTQKPLPQHWTNAAVGRSGMHLSVVATKWDDESGSESPGANRAELVLDNVNAKTFFAQLQADAVEIGDSISAPLTWHNPENANMCRIYVRRQGDRFEEAERALTDLPPIVVPVAR